MYAQIPNAPPIYNGNINNTAYTPYNATGNRINKTVNGKETWYVRDAQGNVMSVYDKDASLNSGHFTQSELHLYGSSRLGIYNLNKDLTLQVNAPVNLGSGNSGGFGIFERNKKFFELSNHLGNVLATVSDKKIGHDAGNGTIDYYEADVASANDYYPFGMSMPARTFRGGQGIYRYGFNGKELDKETSSTTTYDYGFRIYSSALGRFLSVDPLTNSYPWNSPYSYAEGDPINYIDLDGLERTQERAVATPTPTRPKINIKVDKDLLNGRNSGRVPDKSGAISESFYTRRYSRNNMVHIYVSPR